jgi:hypothetical protein
MPITMYRGSVPVFVRGLRTLLHYLDKAQAHAESNGLAPDTLVNARLAPDMLPFSGQIQRASDTSKGTIGRLTGVKPPSMPDNETAFDELRQRIVATLAFLGSVGEAQFDGSEAREVTLSFGEHKIAMPGDEYLLTFGLPNFFFHVATAHGILRSQGVAVGKLDYLKGLD